MKQLTCEMCGSTEMLKQDGVFVCQSCSTKYSVEEAKKMMVEGVVEVTGTVKVDKTDSVANLLKLAENALSAKNLKEAVEYANRVLEIAPENYKAWVIKGKAAGWQSSVANNRFSESIECFIKAVDNVPENEADEIKKDVVFEMIELSHSMISLCCNNFENIPGESTANSIINIARSTKRLAHSFLEKCGEKIDSYDEYMATKITLCVNSVWRSKVLHEVGNRPNEYEWKRFKERAFACISILECAIELSNKNDEADIQRYKDLINITQILINSNGFSVSYSGGNKYYYPVISLADSAKQENINKIAQYQRKLKELDPNYQIQHQGNNANKGPSTYTKIGAVIGAIIGGILGVILCNLIMSTISTPIGRANNPQENDFFILLIGFGAPLLLGLIFGALIGSKIDSSKNKKSEEEKKQREKQKENSEDSNDNSDESSETETEKENNEENGSVKKSKRRFVVIGLSVLAGIVALIILISTLGGGGSDTNTIIGTWKSNRDSSMTMTFKSNGDMTVRVGNAVNDEASYKITGNQISVTFSPTDTTTYYFEVVGKTLILGENEYTRMK